MIINNLQNANLFNVLKMSVLKTVNCNSLIIIRLKPYCI